MATTNSASVASGSVVLSSAGSTNSLVLTLSGTGVVQGYVYESDGVTPVVGVVVSLAVQDGLLSGETDSVLSGAGGSFEFLNVPVAALIPLTILWFGIGETQKVMFIFIAAVPFVFATAAASILAVPDRYVDTARTLGASDRQIMLKVLVPTAMPEMYRGLRGLFGLSFGYIMLAELINAPHGLGAMLNISQRRGLTEHIFLILGIISLIAWAIDHGLAWVEKKLFPHQVK